MAVNNAALTTPLIVALAAALLIALVAAPLFSALTPTRPIRPCEQTDTDTVVVSRLAGRLAGWISQSARVVTFLRRHRARTAPVSADVVSAWCDALARRLRAGTSLRQTLLTEIPTDRTLCERTAPMRQSMEHGAAVADAVLVALDDRLRDGHLDPHLSLLRSVLAASADFGGSAAEPIDRVAAALRLRTVDGQERAAQSAQAKLSANVLTVVPLGLLAVLAWTDRDVRAVIGSGIGSILITTGLALNLAGWAWMKRTITGTPS